MKTYIVNQTYLVTLVYLPEANSEEEAMALVNGGQVPIDHEVNTDKLKQWVAGSYPEGMKPNPTPKMPKHLRMPRAKK